MGHLIFKHLLFIADGIFDRLVDTNINKTLLVYDSIIRRNNINELKILLANKTTSLLHGERAAKNSEQAAKEAFSGNSLGSNLSTSNN